MGGGAAVPGGPNPATTGSAAGPAVSMDTMREDFLDFFDAEYDPVVAFVMRNGAGLAEALDAAQEAFMRAWQLVPTRRWSKIRHPRAWIRAVALNHYRQERRRRATLLNRGLDTADAGVGHAELTGQVLDVVAMLKLIEDEDARAVLALDMDDIPGPQIAAELGFTEQHVRDLRKKARRTLKRHPLVQHRLTVNTPRPTDAEGSQSQ